MNKEWLCVLLILMSSCVLASEDIVVGKQGMGISQAEVDLFLKSAPINVQLEALKKRTDFEKKLEELYLTKVVADATKKAPLNTEEQVQLDDTLKLFYFNLQINRLATQNLPDFEPLAAVYYKAHKEQYIEPEQIAIEHIMLDTRKKYKDQEALKLAKDIIAQLKKGADFSALALKYSDDPGVKEN
jgi:parvulin-like peptidyl-prolyl isomerase